MGQESSKIPICVILGPTAVGKTKMSLALAKKYQGEIISADSMQVYRGMDIGTAKATSQEQHEVPHYLIDICSPSSSFSVAEYQLLAKQKIEEISARGKLPFLVGGTGLYIESVCYQFEFSQVGQDMLYRQHLETYANQFGDLELYQRLVEIDPQMASRLHPNDRRRVIRSLEIQHLSGVTHSEYLAKQLKQSPYQLCIIGLFMERSILYKRVEQRIDEMLQKGLLDEVNALLRSGCPLESSSMQAIGYKELIGYLQGQYNYEQAVELLKRNSRHYVKRQMSWFNHMNEIFWLDVSDSTKFTTHFQLISDIIESKLSKN